MEYQEHYSQNDPTLLDFNRRLIKAKKIASVISDFTKINPDTCIFLDIGCSAGINTVYFGTLVKESVGIEFDSEAVKIGNAQKNKNVTLLIGDAIHLPFKDEIFEVVICNHIYEHVPDAQILMDEVYRILKPGGICYFGATNRFCFIEPHYQLPFLSWLPKPIANCYLSVLHRKTPYYENLRSYYGIRALFSGFSVKEYTVEIIRNPDRFNAGDIVKEGSIFRYIPKVIWIVLMPIIPTYIFVLSKSKKD